jgi:hypothetical protein
MPSDHDHFRMHDPSFQPWWKTRSGIVLCGFLLIAGFYLLTEHAAHFFGVLPIGVAETHSTSEWRELGGSGHRVQPIMQWIGLAERESGSAAVGFTGLIGFQISPARDRVL